MGKPVLRRDEIAECVANAFRLPKAKARQFVEEELKSWEDSPMYTAKVKEDVYQYLLFISKEGNDPAEYEHAWQRKAAAGPSYRAAAREEEYEDEETWEEEEEVTPPPSSKRAKKGARKEEAPEPEPEKEERMKQRKRKKDAAVLDDAPMMRFLVRRGLTVAGVSLLDDIKERLLDLVEGLGDEGEQLARDLVMLRWLGKKSIGEVILAVKDAAGIEDLEYAAPKTVRIASDKDKDEYFQSLGASRGYWVQFKPRKKENGGDIDFDEE